MKLIKNVKIPANLLCQCEAGKYKDNEFLIRDIVFDKNEIIQIGTDVPVSEGCEIISGKGLVALPGLIDVHVHLREPGNEKKETIKTGTMAAAAGGMTTIMAMPNVFPFPDNVETIKEYQKLIDKEAVVNVIPYSCITQKEGGEQVVDMAAIKELGYRAFSDDGVGVQTDGIMEKAMEKSAELGVMIVAHTEDMTYRKPKACINEGAKAKELGLIGIPNECEYKQFERDLKLVEKTGAHYHCCHMSAKESVELLREYKAKGLDVSGEATCHHLILTEDDIEGTNWKMNPPLKTTEDRRALIDAIKDGTITIIANDHAPHTEEEKAKSMEEAPFGIVTIESAFSLLYTHLVKTGEITLVELVRLMSENPANRFGMERKGVLKEGFASDIILVDLDNEFVIDKEKFYSKGRNTPFHGWKCYGRVKQTFVNGISVYKEEN